MVCQGGLDMRDTRTAITDTASVQSARFRMPVTVKLQSFEALTVGWKGIAIALGETVIISIRYP